MKREFTILCVVLLGAILLFTQCQQTEITSAKVYMQQANYDKAIEQCKLAIEKVPANPISQQARV